MALIRLGLPKGSLQEATFKMMRKAGFKVSLPNSRSYLPSIDDEELELMLVRAQEIARYVEDGVLEAGITGRDWVKENHAEVYEVCELQYSKQQLTPVRWVVAVPQNGPIQKTEDLEGKRIATELVQVTKDFLAEKGIKAEVEFSWGATEVKVPELVDAIVELTETGSSLRANKLKIIDTVMESVTLLIANKKTWADEAKKQKLENIALLLQGAILAEEKVGLKMNVPKENLAAVIDILPAMREPTVSPLHETNWVAIDTIVDEHTVRIIIPQLKRAGAEGIIEYPLNKVIY